MRRVQMPRDRVYKCLNPGGIQESVDVEPLAPRLDKLDGKNIVISCQEADPVIMPALVERLKRDFPKVNWRVKDSHETSSISMTPEEMETTDAVVQGVAW
jgi:predicted esterase